MAGRSWLVGVTLLCGWLLVASAAAQGRPRVAVAGVQGPQARKVQGYIEGALRSQVELVAANGTPRSDADFARLAEQLDAQAIVSARIVKKRRFAVTVTVHQGRDGRSVGEHTWEQRKPAQLSVIQRELWAQLGSAIRNAEGVAEPEPEPEPDPIPTRSTGRTAGARTTPALPDRDETDDEDEGEDDSPGAKRQPALRFELGVGPMWRDQAYNDAGPGTPYRYYNEIGSPALWLGLSLAWYPVALVSDSALGNLGLVGGFGTALGLSSSTADGGEIDTSASSFHVGLRGRLPIDRSELGLTLAYGSRRFSTDAPMTTPVPDVNHTFLRIAGDGRLAIGASLGVELALGYLLRLGSGELEEDAYYPKLSGGGLDFGIGGVLAIGQTGLSLRAGLDWQYFFSSFNVPQGAMRVTGGSADHFYTFMLSARYELTTK